MALLATRTNRQLAPWFRGPGPRRRARTVAGVLLALLAWFGCDPTAPLAGNAEPGASKEYQVKAAFIYNFTKFVEWPSDSFPDASAPLVIAVLGSNPFGPELQKAVENRRVNGRELIIRNISTVAELTKAQVAFLGLADPARMSEALAALRQRPVLTIGERESFVRDGGMIGFILEGDKVRFAINMEAAQAGGLKISAQLQKLATSVRTKP